jgi:hypothetical protein
MVRPAMILVGLVTAIGCHKHTGAPPAAPTTTPTATATTTASPCDEVLAALEASASAYPGYAIQDKPATSGADVPGFVSSRTVPGATSCIVQGEPDPALWCSLGPPASPTDTSRSLRSASSDMPGTTTRPSASAPSASRSAAQMTAPRRCSSSAGSSSRGDAAAHGDVTISIHETFAVIS